MAKPDQNRTKDRADDQLMGHAIGLARRGLGSVWPNPSVGCVIVSAGRIVGRGTTQPGGRPHAETQALAQAGPLSRNATAFVTLEPCAHHGKSPPCADALINAGIRSAHVALRDPDPRVNGKGVEKLQDAGITVTIGTCADDARRLNAGFLSRVRRNRPWVTLKLATTLDGRIATATGESQWITSPEARRMTHFLRSQNDAILTGHGTIAADDPMLDTRGMGPVPTPLRVILDSNLGLKTTSRIARTANRIPTWILTANPQSGGDLRDLGMDVIGITASGAGLDIASALTTLATRGITRVFCEGGAKVAASLLDADLVDEIVIFQAGRFFGASGLGAVAALSDRPLAQMPSFAPIAVLPIGPDTVSFWAKPPPD